MTFQHPIANLTPGVAPALQQVRRYVTSAEVLALTDGTDTASIEMIPAPGEGKAVYVDGWWVRSVIVDDTPAAYTGGTVAIGFVGNADNIISMGTGASSPLRGTTTRTARAGVGQSVSGEDNVGINMAVELRAAATATPLAAGNSDLQVTIHYRIVEV